jgi:hypothetical protein
MQTCFNLAIDFLIIGSLLAFLFLSSLFAGNENLMACAVFIASRLVSAFIVTAKYVDTPLVQTEETFPVLLF